MSNPASLVWAALSAIYGTFSDKTASERNYKVIVPAVHSAIDGGASYEDDYIQASVEALKSLAPSGAKRHNFYKHYLMDIDGLSRLPVNPISLSIAYWW